MFETAEGSNKCHVYGFGSNSAATISESQGGISSSSMPSVSFATVHDCYADRDKRWMIYTQHVQDTFTSCMEKFAKKVTMQHDLVPTLFPFPLMDAAPSDAPIFDPQPSPCYHYSSNAPPPA